MLATKYGDMGYRVHACGCGREAKIVLIGYANKRESNDLCADCALQVIRKLSEDLCELQTFGGRHG